MVYIASSNGGTTSQDRKRAAVRHAKYQQLAILVGAVIGPGDQVTLLLLNQVDGVQQENLPTATIDVSNSPKEIECGRTIQRRRQE